MDTAIAAPFFEVTRKFIASVDSPPSNRTDFFNHIEPLMAQLVAAAHELPKVEPSDSDAPWVSTANAASLRTVVAEADLYWDVLNPTVVTTSAEAAVGSLVDDLSEIRADLMRGLALWDRDDKTDAIWECRFGFETHWGTHALDALRIIHIWLW